MKIETNNVITVKTFAKGYDVSTSYVYRLIREGKMSSILIDDVHFLPKGTVLPTR
jgi:hypothetical protein